MKQTFTVDSEGNVITHESRKEAEAYAAANEADYCAGFDSADTLGSVLETAPTGLAVLIWNGLPGVKALDRFKSRKIAAERIFRYLQGRDTPEAAETATDEAAEPVAKPKKAKLTRKPKAEKRPRKEAKKAKFGKRAAAKLSRSLSPVPKRADSTSKKAQVIEMISKKGGATLEAIMKATGWQPHTTRGALSTLASKGGHNIESFKTEAGERAYRIA